MKLISDADLRTAFPEDLHYYERLNEGQAQTYRYLATAYRKLLNAYVAYMGVGKYDLALQNNARLVVPVPSREYDFYQRYANGELQYFYVRNNTYIERLSRDELGFLRTRLQERNLMLDYDSAGFVADTFARVIRERWEGKDGWSEEDAAINFGPDEKRFFCPNGALVVGCRVEEGQGREVLEDVLKCGQELEASLGKRLPVPVSVVLYDEASVRPLS